MNVTNKKIHAVPTNIITGFLGVGKTSAILQLLKHKPQHERWAILVNEFGEIGVDGSLFQGQHQEDSGVYIREVPGGCMCCAAGLPMQIALNQLLQRSKPDRLLIEPTGLGHPLEVMQILNSHYYNEVLSLHQVITLVDARKLSDERYTKHQTFNQQIAIADVIVGNKTDLYQQGDQQRLTQYVAQHCHEQAKVTFTRQGALAIDMLHGKTSAMTPTAHHHHQQSDMVSANEIPLPACGYLKAENKGEGYQSLGWRFEPNKIFNRQALIAFFHQLNAERMKAVFITNDGIYGYNLTSDALTQTTLDDCMESRIEIIAQTLNDEWEQGLLSCLN